MIENFENVHKLARQAKYDKDLCEKILLILSNGQKMRVQAITEEIDPEFFSISNQKVKAALKWLINLNLVKRTEEVGEPMEIEYTKFDWDKLVYETRKKTIIPKIAYFESIREEG